MDFQKENSHIYCKNDFGQIIAEITFPEVEAGVFCINHTFVDDSLRGQGVAGKLVKMAVEEIQSRNGKVTATCSYAQNWLEKHRVS
ncbi:MAG: N-acetyltransferase [Ruminococcus sp.]|nr:N-acetyltransferase [Ruminococcus sp.]